MISDEIITKEFDVRRRGGEPLNEDKIIGDYAELVALREREESNDNLRNLISKTERALTGNDKYIIKMFLVNNNTGIMINADDARNASFRVDTVNGIFDGLADALTDAGLDAAAVDRVFERTGRRCGETFAQGFARWSDRRSGGEQDAEQLIREWCKFDSAVGWGKLEYDGAAGCVTIHNNFEAARNEATRRFPRDCAFFRGYAEGVLGVLLGRDVAVRCAEGMCPKKLGGKTCRFEIG